MDIEAPIARYGVAKGVSAPSLARRTRAVLRGAVVLAEATGEASPAVESLVHLCRYVEAIFGRAVRDRGKDPSS